MSAKRRISLSSLKTTLRALQESGLAPVALDQLPDGTLRWHFTLPRVNGESELDRELAEWETKNTR